ncbi:MAG: methylated-DNA--[protein]-cysteine S-methyltransferase [Acidobacteriaceae bacterium]|nr:methylated-DNA--[protein]-cysteine S-methyltransferase [Acidobacteriaceae bacterium]
MQAVQKNSKNNAIQYTTADSSLGRMLVAATDRGVCLVAFAKNDKELIGELHERFPDAGILPARNGQSRWLAEAVRFIASQTNEHPIAAAFPLDVRATPFQAKVWRALQAIPRGETRTYSALAKQLGNPKATRAVARAIAANPVAVVVPCHRVIGKDGSLTGYRWGIERKRQLLAAEQM